ncbi:hypothetical protein CPB83DRAFT_900656 [Crepidotus variabilis]|uniref:Uncharacterized protein n=1 Tax=Crepidotus variabilis TaxID=179855 RepID=A0A9P6BBY6_9AGAR|nr:hypothetical protein CPB83DRAFT_900656 [Crepidotus variabilis]
MTFSAAAALDLVYKFCLTAKKTRMAFRRPNTLSAAALEYKDRISITSGLSKWQIVDALSGRHEALSFSDLRMPDLCAQDKAFLGEHSARNTENNVLDPQQKGQAHIRRYDIVEGTDSECFLEGVVDHAEYFFLPPRMLQSKCAKLLVALDAITSAV